MNNPKLYAETNDLARVSAEFILDKYGKLLTWTDDETIIEFGIGTGNTTKNVVLPRIPSNFVEYYATDINKSFVNMAKRTLGNHAKLNFGHLDIAVDEVSLEFKEKFNHIMSFLTMHWVKEPRKAFKNMLEMLKPGGEIFLMYFDKSPIDGALKELDNNSRWAKYEHKSFISPYFYDIDPLIACEKDMLAAGIKNYKIELERMVFYFPSEDNCLNGLYSVNPVLDNIPKDEIEDYKRDYVEYAMRTGGYFEGYKLGNRFIGINYNLIVIYAKK